MAGTRRDQGERPAASVNAPPDMGGAMVAVRTMPESLSAEAAVLGSMLIYPECIGDVVEFVERDSFYRMEHRHIFEALISLYEKNQGVGIDAVLLRDELARQSTLEDAGGVEYIARILDSVPSAANVVYYSKVVKDKMLLRELIATAGSILDRAYDQTGEAGEVLDEAESKMFAITDRNVTVGASALKDLVVRSFELIEGRQGTHVTGLDTGYYELNDMTCGMQKGEMIIVAGRPSMGKTSLALNIA